MPGLTALQAHTKYLRLSLRAVSDGLLSRSHYVFADGSVRRDQLLYAARAKNRALSRLPAVYASQSQRGKDVKQLFARDTLMEHGQKLGQAARSPSMNTLREHDYATSSELRGRH